MITLDESLAKVRFELSYGTAYVELIGSDGGTVSMPAYVLIQAAHEVASMMLDSLDHPKGRDLVAEADLSTHEDDQ